MRRSLLENRVSPDGFIADRHPGQHPKTDLCVRVKRVRGILQKSKSAGEIMLLVLLHDRRQKCGGSATIWPRVLTPAGSAGKACVLRG